MGRLLIILLAAVLVACAQLVPSVQERLRHANALALKAGWQMQIIPTRQFDLAAFTPKIVRPTSLLTVYIEGDGLAWISQSLVSANPTPIKPIGLMLALQHPAGAAAYLGRPCQYVENPDTRGCQDRYWTDGRFSTEVVEASNQAIDVLKQQYGAKQLQLIGYSGGGAIAALLAARRNDVARLVTVAGNLDHRTWTRQHRITPLKSSLNPVDYWRQLTDIRQVHFVGGKDTIVSREISASYRAKFPAGRKPQIKIMPDFTHACCWVGAWPQLAGE